MAGEWHTHNGGGANYLCLPPDPTFDGGDPGNQDGALIYRTEYQFDGNGISKWSDLHNWDAPCAVCQAPSDRSYQFLVPGRQDCPKQMTLDYSGYIVSDRSNHRVHEFVCMDENPEKVGSSGDENGALLYPTEMDHFPHYNNYWEPTCAQCSSSRGPVYVNWGRRHCHDEDGVDELYSGYTATTHHSTGHWHERWGGGYNYLCMHPEPQYNAHDSGSDHQHARLFQVEWESASHFRDDLGWDKLNNDAVPCAVCQANRGVTLYMQPGSVQCPEGWIREYDGFIMSNRQYHHRHWHWHGWNRHGHNHWHHHGHWHDTYDS
jgi:hypothetical protein